MLSSKSPISPFLIKNSAVIGDKSSYKAYRLLYICFIILPMIVGIDKFFDVVVRWPQYLAPWVSHTVDHVMSVRTFMKIGGVTEVMIALLVALKPRIGSFVVAFWLWAIILNLVTVPGYYDIALRDFGLSLGALALGFLAKEYSF